GKDRGRGKSHLPRQEQIMADKKNPSPAAGVSQGKVPASGLTKFEAVKRAQAALGKDAMPLALRDYVKKKYGVEISGEVASSYKKALKRKQKTAAKPAAAPKPAVAKAAAKKSTSPKPATLTS